MGREKKKNEEGETNGEVEERNRLKSLCYANNILSKTPPPATTKSLNPSKTLLKHHGKDILKKSQRKNRYLFSFSGLFAPISAGKIGELTNLASKNPTLYLHFPQGRMKLFGTIVYPKNRYLTLQLSKNVMCEDCFDNIIVFSDACWVGNKQDNPHELRLDFPKDLFQVKHTDFDFKAGAGAGATVTASTEIKKVATKATAEESLSEMEIESPERHLSQKHVVNITPVRQSGRTTAKKFNFAEVSSGEDSDESSSSLSGEVNEDTAKSLKSFPVTQDHIDLENSAGTHNSEGNAEAVLSTFPTSGAKVSSQSSLVQATISTLFKKVEEKKTCGSSKKTAILSEKKQLDTSSLNNKKAKTADQEKVDIISQDKKPRVRSGRKKRKAELLEVEDDIKESSSASEDFDDESDDDWEA